MTATQVVFGTDLNQQTFDRVITHLVTQGQRAYDTGCKYRTSSGLKCAVGCLIPDEMYHPEMEHQSVRTLCNGFENVNALMRSLTDNGSLDLLYELQEVHDSSRSWNEDGPGVSRGFWYDAKKLADRFELTMDNVKHLNVYAWEPS